MTRTWADLSRELTALRRSDPTLVQRAPSSLAPEPRPPWTIVLAAHGESVAEQLHSAYGADVALVVGGLRYPTADHDPRWPARDPAAGTQPVDPLELLVELDAPIPVGSGHTVRSGLRLTNLGDTPLTVNTNGHVNGHVADPETGAVIGGFVGFEPQPLIRFPAEPGRCVVIPLIIGTAGVVPSGGYRVPPGDWALFAILELDDGRRLRTPLLPLTITP